MTTQYTPTLKLALPVTGELSGTWGDVVNDNITSMVEQAIAGLATINTWSANAHTLTTANGTSSESRCAMLVAQDAAGLAAAGQIVCPSAAKLYVLKNDTSYQITLKTAAGTGVAVASGNTAFLFCDGTNVNACVTTIVDGRVTGNLTVDGNATINGNTTLGNATSDTVTVTARVASSVLPSADNTYDLGSTANSWKDLYIDGTATIATLNATTIDTTNIEVTNIKAKDGTAVITLTNSTGAASFSNNVNLGTTGSNTVQVNGYMGIGGATSASAALYIANQGLSGTTQSGIWSTPTSTTAATSQVNAFVSQPRTLAFAFTATSVSGLRVEDAIKGAGSTITNQYGVLVADQSAGTNSYGVVSQVTSGSSKWNIYASGTANNAFAGNVRIGATTAPSNALDVTGSVTVSGNTTLGDASTDTVTVNGYMGVGGAAGSASSIIAQGSSLTSTSQTGVTVAINGNSSATSRIRGFASGLGTTASAFTVTDLANFWASDSSKGAGSTITNQHGLYIADQTQGTNNYGITSLVSSGSNKWNIYASGTADNAFAGNVRIGSTTAPSNALDVTGAMTVSGNTTLGDASTDTVTVNGYMGVGGAGSSSYSLYVRSTALTGAYQFGLYNTITGTSAATGGVTSYSSEPSSAASAYTVTDVIGYRAFNALKGAGSTIANLYGVLVDNQTTGTNNYGVASAVSSGSNKWNIYASGTANNAFAGNVRIGSTTAPSNALDVTGSMTVSADATVTGNATVNGNATLGDASTDTVRVNGTMGIGGAATTNTALYVRSTALASISQYGVLGAITGTSAGTTVVASFVSAPSSDGATAYTVTSMVGYRAFPGTKAGLSTVTSMYGVLVDDQTGGTNNYGVASTVSSGSNKWNIYASGTANNAFAGNVRIGSTTAPTNALDVTGVMTVSGNALVVGTGGLGYGTGSGGAVTQITSRTTGVTLNKTNGAITLVSAAGSTAWQSFTVTNSTVAATDTIIVNQKSGTDLYEIHVTAVAAGSFRLSFKTTGGTTTEQPVFNFAVIKAVTA